MEVFKNKGTFYTRGTIVKKKKTGPKPVQVKYFNQKTT